MNTLLNRGLLLLIFFLGLSALACNLPFGGEDPTPTPTTINQDEDPPENNPADEENVAEDEPEPAKPVEVEPAPEAEISENDNEPAEEENEGLFSGLFAESINVAESAQQFESLESYQMQLDFGTTVDDETQQMQALILTSVDPPASQMTFNFVGFVGPVDLTEIKMTQIAETTYTIVPELGCITLTEGDFLSESFGQSMDANQFLEDIGEAQLVGEETINGVETLHYTFDETVIQDDEFEFNWAQGDVYVAREGDFVVRFRLEGEGIVNDLGFAMDTGLSGSEEPQVGLIQVEMNLTNINEPVDITVPAECSDSGLDNAEFPVLDDAYESSSFGGVITYKTETAFADAVAFYQASLGDDGWVYQEGDSFILEGSTALMFFSKDGRILTVTITEETGTQAFLIVVFEE